MTRFVALVLGVMLLLAGCATPPPAPQKKWVWSRPPGSGGSPEQFQIDRGQCWQQTLALPATPMPPAPSPPMPPRYSGGYAPTPGFAEGVASGEYEDTMSRYRADERRRRDDFFTACMFGRGYIQVPE